MTHDIPRIDIGALFGQDLAARSAVDQAILTAARSEGMLVITGLPHWAVLSPARRRLLLSLFALPEADIRKLWRWNFDPAQANVYRGWFPLQNGLPTYKQGIDVGPDIAYGPGVVDPRDPLREATPLPPEDSLPGWHACARDYYLAMVRLSEALMHSVARGLGLPEHCFDAAFKGGVSTLRLLHYPVRPPESFEGAAARIIRRRRRRGLGRPSGQRLLPAGAGSCRHWLYHLAGARRGGWPAGAAPGRHLDGRAA